MGSFCHDHSGLNLSDFNDLQKNISNSSNVDNELFDNPLPNMLSRVFELFIIFMISDVAIFYKKDLKEIFYKIKTLKILPLLLFSFLFSPIIITILCIFKIYRSIIHLLLKHKFGANFKGLLEGTDAVWSVEDLSKSVINTLIVIETNNIQEFTTKLKIKLSNIILNKNFEKLTYYRDKSYGYNFWKEDQFEINNIVKYMEPLDKEMGTQELQTLIAKYSNNLLPANHAISWEILIGTQPIIKTNQYPVIFRFHHSIGDGIAMIKLLLEASDVKCGDDNLRFATQEKSAILKIKQLLLTKLQMCLPVFYITKYLLETNMLNTIDDNCLYGAKLTGEKCLAWKTEDKDMDAVALIKTIKNRIPGVTFTDVLLTALSDSLNQYFHKKSKNIPKTINIIFPIRLENFLNNQDNYSEMQNNFSLGLLKLPVFSKGTNTIFDRLQEVKNEINLLKHSAIFLYNYWIIKVIGTILPEPLLRPMVTAAHSTMGVSNIQGPTKIKICDGYLVKDMMFWLPHRHLTGIGISIISYDDKLKFGIIADKALISQVEDINEILENMFKSLKKLNTPNV